MVVVELGVEVVVVVVVDGPVVVVAFGVEAVAVAVAVVDAPVVVVVVVDGPVVAVGVDDALLVVVVGAGVTVVEVGSAARAANIPSEDATQMLEIWSLQSRFQIVGWFDPVTPPVRGLPHQRIHGVDLGVVVPTRMRTNLCIADSTEVERVPAAAVPGSMSWVFRSAPSSCLKRRRYFFFDPSWITYNRTPRCAPKS
ncbi:hypothetical protein GS425_01020 [Rhodococcus hoagii]|nr:hypothetical protein [Prescottella equi]